MAIFYAYRSLLIEPTVAEAYHGLGALFFNSDRMKEAKEVFEHLLRMEPDSVEGVCGYVSDDRNLFSHAAQCLGFTILLSSF